jgi:serine/threonine protein kinase/WD40 repeat protein
MPSSPNLKWRRGDPDLRRCVEKLLAAQPRVGEFLQAPADGLPAAANADTVDHPADERPGTILGPYKLLHEIGEGGMGTVWMAEQTHPVKRRVALKVIKAGMDSRQVLARFEAERQALALMDHPNIAKVLDAGATDAGRPYFVMELVKGQPVTEFCDKNRLTTQERLELFVAVCNAIQHAHQKGVIHRDVKPSNVLIALYDGKPVPKVIDFGVAKAVGDPLTDRTLFTRHGQVVGTFEYMSPEQANLDQLDIDTRSDVYALGALLYELLTGTTPLDKDRLRQAGFAEVLRLIREEEPPKPSTRLTSTPGLLATAAAHRKTDSQKLPRAVRGELDWIVMKALDKDRNRRFPTANGLAADVERFLKGEPVQACPPTLGYRFRKYARKNNVAFTIGAAVAATLMIGIIATSWQAIRAWGAEQVALTSAAAEAEQRAVAVREQQKAQHEADAARAARDQFRRSHYALQMNALQRAWASDNVVRATELLDELKPAAGEDDLRGFEWHYWDRVLHAESGRRVIPVSPVQDQITPGRIEFSGDGSRAAFLQPGRLDPTTGEVKPTSFAQHNAARVHIIDLPTEKILRTFMVSSDSGRRWGVALNHDGSRIAVVQDSVKRHRAGQNDPAAPPTDELNPQNRVRQVSRLHDQVEVYDAATGRKLLAARGEFDTEIALSADGKRLATIHALEVDDDGLAKPSTPIVVKLFDVDNSEREPATLKANVAMRQSSLVFSHDGTCLATILNDRTAGTELEVQLWDAASGQRIGATKVTDASYVNLTLNRDGSRIIGIASKARPARRGVPDLEVDHIFCVWEVAPGGAIKQVTSRPMDLPRTGTGTQKVVLSPDGRRLFVFFTRGFSKVVDAATGDAQRTIKSLLFVRSGAFNPDGTRLVTSAAVSGNLIFSEWDLTRRDPEQPAIQSIPFDTAASQTNTVSSADGRRTAHFTTFRPGGVPDHDIVTRDADGKEIYRFAEHKSTLFAVWMSPNGRFVCSSDAAGATKLWEADTGKVRLSYETDARDPRFWPSELGDAGFAFRFSFHGQPPTQTRAVIAVSDGDGRVLIHFDDLREIVRIPGATGVTLSPDGQRAFSTDRSTTSGRPKPGDLKIWDTATGRQLPTEPVRLLTATFSGDFRRMATLSRATEADDSATLLKVWDTDTGRVLATEAVNANAVVFSPDRRLVLVDESRGPAGEADVVSVWDADTLRRRFDVDSVPLNDVLARGRQNFRMGAFSGNRILSGAVFSPDQTRVVIGTQSPNPGRGLRSVPTVFDLTTGKRLFRLEGNMTGFAPANFSPDGKRIVSTMSSPANDGEIKVWDAVSGHELLTLTTETEFSGTPGDVVQFTPDSHFLRRNVRNGAPGQPVHILTWDGTPRAEAPK